MTIRLENPLIVQADHSILLETMGPHFAAARNALVRFAELVKSPEYVHTYRLTPLSLWNAAAAGHTAEEVVSTLEDFAKYPVAPNVPVWVRETMGRYGRIVLRKGEGELEGRLLLEADDPLLMRELRNLKHVQPMLGRRVSDTSNAIDPGQRGELKQALVKAGHPVKDLAGYEDGDLVQVSLVESLGGGRPFALRDYQVHAVDAFLGDGLQEGGSGVVVLPCGAGKTVVGIATLVRLGMRTLVLCNNVTAVHQWRRELLEKTSLTPDQIGEYTGETKDVRPVTLSTYQILTWRRSKFDDFEHFALFDGARWGLVIYDEVHLLPAPVFRTVAHLQARRRLGLTATLVREDGKEGDVFALIGPKRFDIPWKDLEHQGWIASAHCTEVRLGLSTDDRMRYAVADDREKFRIASTNPRKGLVLDDLLKRHEGEKVLVLGMYLDQLEWAARRHEVPLITGQTPQSRRDELFQWFREADGAVLALSRVGNFAVDLPDAAVAIQISGTWGSRQEEAQRLGRLLRPKVGSNQAAFYSLVTRDTTEQEYAEKRQLFLTEQGYAYSIETRD